MDGVLVLVVVAVDNLACEAPLAYFLVPVCTWVLFWMESSGWFSKPALLLYIVTGVCISFGFQLILGFFVLWHPSMSRRSETTIFTNAPCAGCHGVRTMNCPSGSFRTDGKLRVARGYCMCAVLAPRTGTAEQEAHTRHRSRISCLHVSTGNT